MKPFLGKRTIMSRDMRRIMRIMRRRITRRKSVAMSIYLHHHDVQHVRLMILR
jgi:hypothetical protein